MGLLSQIDPEFRAELPRLLVSLILLHARVMTVISFRDLSAAERLALLTRSRSADRGRAAARGPGRRSHAVRTEMAPTSGRAARRGEAPGSVMAPPDRHPDRDPAADTLTPELSGSRRLSQQAPKA
jgi:hypothetical protein